MSELRQNLATGEWVVVAPERLKGKPLQPEPNRLLATQPAHADDCPFCPANEARFPHVETDLRPALAGNGRWQVRGIENKYKIFTPAGAPHSGEFERDGIYARLPAHGIHELVIENPAHNQTLGTMSQAEVASIVALWVSRFRALCQERGHRLTILFKNHGQRSGASQLHPHSQILSSRVVPNVVRNLINEAIRYFDAHGICVFCKMLAYEIDAGTRLVHQSARFVAFTPYAQATPYQVEIYPKTHDSLFEDMGGEETADFADCLRVVMAKIYGALSNPDFNLILRNPPHSLGQVPFYHWHLRVIPHLRLPGGFELGSRVSVNVMAPEDCAQHLRRV